MADNIGDPGPSTSAIYATDFLEQSLEEGNDMTRKLETDNEAIMVLDMIKRDLQEVYLKCRTIDDSVKCLKRYIEDDKRRKSCELSRSSVSPIADSLISTTKGPLTSDELKDFFMEKAFGKPKPCVLPIVRHYTNQIPGLIDQLTCLTSDLNREHERHMKYRSMDVNLIKRIERLIKNIGKEVEEEGKDGRRQTSIFQFTHSTPKPTGSW